MDETRIVTLIGRHADGTTCCESKDPRKICPLCSRALHHSQIRAAMEQRALEKAQDASDIAERAAAQVMPRRAKTDPPVPEVKAAVDIDYSKFTPPDPYAAALKSLRAQQGIALPTEVIETAGCPDGYASHLAAIRGE